MPPILFTSHAETEIGRRKLRREWVERIANSPEWTEPDQKDPALTRGYGAIAEAGNKVLRVVYADRVRGRWVITAFFDSGAVRRRQRSRS